MYVYVCFMYIFYRLFAFCMYICVNCAVALLSRVTIIWSLDRKDVIKKNYYY